MRVCISEEAVEELSQRKRKRSLSAMDTSSDDSSSEDGHAPSYASSVTLPARSPSTEAAASSEKRLTDIETKLTSQEAMLQRLLSASEPVSPPASTPEEVYEPPPAHASKENQEPCISRTPADIYEDARVEAGFSDWHEWNTAYIHGMIRIDGKQSKSMTKYPPCGPCGEASKFAVCVGLMDDDPYQDFLLGEKKVCCGWCEYEKMHGEEDRQQEEKYSRPTAPASCQERKPQQNPAQGGDMDGHEPGRQPTRQSEFFINGAGLDPEVVQNDIPLWLGIDSLVRPGTHYDLASHKRTEGYYIIAHRPPTSAMLADLRADSAAWRTEKEKRKLDDPKNADLDAGYSGKQPPRYQTWSFDFDYNRL